MRVLAFPLAIAALAGLQAQEPTWTDPPRLVVGIVVDQMRTDLLYRYWDNLGDGGFRRLVREGSFQRDAHYNYVPTQTAPGHASIYTGTTPARHGIVANHPYNRDRRRTVYIGLDTAVSPVGTFSTKALRSPVNLLATTLADELELRTAGRAHTVGVALKDRSAMLPMGRMGDQAYWFAGDDQGKFITSSWYADALPPWLQAFNKKGLPAEYLQGTWDLALPRNLYHLPLPDNNPYEESWGDSLPPVLPMDLAILGKDGQDLDMIKYTPWGNTLTTDVAIAALLGNDMGKDEIPDLLSVSYGSTDELAHNMGPRALELEDMYIRLDRELARLLLQLDERVGAGAYTVFLTADHGGGDVPAYLKHLKGSAGYTALGALQAELVQRGYGTWVDTVKNDQVYLRPNAPPGTAQAIARALNEMPQVAYAASADQLLENPASTGLAGFMAKGFMRQRCGDVVIALRPGFFRSHGRWDGKGADHATAWNYDTHVPVIFFGHGVAKGEVLRRTSITDIAPTVAAILGMALPNAADGQVVPEVVRH
ncbi:MAG: alkaline phosphatase family protein [Flavobacteriales bacterium]|nr:alkaline phosphatase family protein [Flavobacteriales bacterium]MBP9079232.1 alkaline phosphatase family protein [Flavobacteriales bacterium]